MAYLAIRFDANSPLVLLARPTYPHVATFTGLGTAVVDTRLALHHLGIERGTLWTRAFASRHARPWGTTSQCSTRFIGKWCSTLSRAMILPSISPRVCHAATCAYCEQCEGRANRRRHSGGLRKREVLHCVRSVLEALSASAFCPITSYSLATNFLPLP